MLLFSELDITSSDIGAAVAEAIIHDIHVNSLRLDGFPEIKITRKNQDILTVNLSFEGHSRGFELSNLDAIEAVQKMKSRRGRDSNIFDRVQDALANLESMVSKPR